MGPQISEYTRQKILGSMVIECPHRRRRRMVRPHVVAFVMAAGLIGVAVAATVLAVAVTLGGAP